MTTTSGVVQIHSAPAALRPHVEWAIGAVFRAPTELVWTPQPAEPGAFRAELPWRGPIGSAAKLASAMKRWQRLRFEVTEEPTGTSEGERYSYTPDLGIFHASAGLNGDIQVHEDRLRSVMASHRDQTSLRAALDDLLGTPWDAELDAFRAAGEGAPLRWLHRVG